MISSDFNDGGYRNMFDDIGAALWRRRGTVIAVFLVTILSAYGALLFLGEQYEAEASLLVKLGRENAEMPLTVQKGELFTSGVQKEEVNSDIQLLSSRNLVEATVDKIGAETYLAQPGPPTGFLKLAKYQLKQVARAIQGYYGDALIALDLRKQLTRRDQVINVVESRLIVDRDKDSNVIHVSLRLPNADLAKRTVETLIDLYLQRHIELHQSDSIGAVFEQQIAASQKQLVQIQENMAVIKSESHIHSVPEQRAALLSRLHQLRAKVEESTAQDAACERQETLIRVRLQELPATTNSTEVVMPNPSVKSVKESLTGLELERVKLASKYLDNSTVLATLDAEIAAVREILAREPQSQTGDVTRHANPIRDDLQKQLEEISINRTGLQASIGAAKEQIAPIEDELQKLNISEDKLHMAEVEQHIVEGKYQTYANRREEARIADELDAKRVANVITLASATAKPEPVYPRKLFLMAMAVVAGLILGVGLALLFESRDETIRRPRDMAEIDGVKFLGTFRLVNAKTAA